MVKVPKFEIRDATGRQFYWRYVADNGETICHSETYSSKQNAISSADLVRRTASAAPIYDYTQSAATSRV